MNRRLLAEYVVGTASALIGLSSIGHAWPGWAGLRQALESHTGPSILRGVGIGWHFGSLSMAVFGLIGLRCAVLMRRGIPEARSIPAVIGAAYLLFGAGAMLATDMRPHYAFFIILGTLLLGGALLWTPEAEGARGDRLGGD